MHKIKWIILLFFLLAGCAPYKKPLVNIPTNWPKQYPFQSKPAVDLPKLSWWKQFHNSELDCLIEKAVKNNYQTNQAIANIEKTKSQLDQVRLSWLPKLSAVAGYSQFPDIGNPGTTIIFYPAYITNIFQLYNQQKSAHAKFEASIYQKYSANLMVISETSALFFTLLAQQEDLELYHQLRRDYQTSLKLNQSQYRSELVSLDGVIENKTQIRIVETQIEQTKHNILITKNALHFLMNEDPGDLPITSRFTDIDSNKLVPGNLPVSVLSARPDICAAEALLRATHAEVGAAAAALLPQMNLGAYLGHGSNAGSIQLGQVYLDGPVIDLPLLASIGASKAELKTNYIHYITAIREALRDVANDLSAYATRDQQLKTNIAALKDEQELCRMAESRYRHGIEDDTSVVKCKIKVDEFKLVISRNKLEKMLALVRLYADLGGGYHGV